MRLGFVRQFAFDDNRDVGVEDNDIWDAVTGASAIFKVKGLVVEKVVAELAQAGC